MIPIVLGLGTLIAKVAAVAALPRAARALRELARPVEAPSGPPREEASSPQHGAKPLTLSKFPATGEGSVEYAYNKRRELSHSYRKVNHECTVETFYRYDQNHNRVKKNETRYSSNANDQLTSVRRPNQTLAYNTAGQAIQAGSSAFTFAYNDQIKSVRNGPNSATYLYDGNGQRVQKTVDGVVSKFLWAGSEIIKEYTAGGQVKAQYLLGAERTAIKTNGRWNFYLSDGLGSTVMLTDYRGRSVATWDYDDFGETTQLSGSPSVYNPFLYTGQELDKETGFYHLRARHYAPSLGKFLSRDPIGYAGGSNLYSYCGGDSINCVDPSGLDGLPIPLPLPASFDVVGLGAGLSEAWAGIVSGLRVAGVPGAVGAGGGIITKHWIDALQAEEEAAIAEGALIHTETVMMAKKKAKSSGKEKASDCPSWAKGSSQLPGEAGKDTAERLLNDKYGIGKWIKGAGSEFSKIQKYFDRR
jgi:RHS repeat-associated protein